MAEARYPRDLRGYGRNPPDPHWPGGARIAVQFVVNFEEGGENNILHGDRASEAFLSDLRDLKVGDFVVHILSGEADLTVDGAAHHAVPGTWVRMPADTSMTPVSRTVGVDQLVDEMVFEFTHTIKMDWMLPGVSPTGKHVKVPLVVKSTDKIYIGDFILNVEPPDLAHPPQQPAEVEDGAPEAEIVAAREEARRRKDAHVDVCFLVTVGEHQRPEARPVSLRDVDERGFGLLLNALSPKWRQIEKSGQCSLTILWSSVERQYRVYGELRPMDPERLRFWWDRKVLGSRLLEHYYDAYRPQSEPVASREAFLEGIAELKRVLQRPLKMLRVSAERFAAELAQI